MLPCHPAETTSWVGMFGRQKAMAARWERKDFQEAVISKTRGFGKKCQKMNKKTNLVEMNFFKDTAA